MTVRISNHGGFYTEGDGMDLVAVSARLVSKGDTVHDPLLKGTVVSVMNISGWYRIETDSECNNVMYFQTGEEEDEKVIVCL